MRNKLLNNKGFTLLEVLLASALLVVVMGGVLLATVSVFGSWKRIKGEEKTISQAEIAFHFFEEDIASFGSRIPTSDDKSITKIQDSLLLTNFANNPIFYGLLDINNSKALYRKEGNTAHGNQPAIEDVIAMDIKGFEVKRDREAPVVSVTLKLSSGGEITRSFVILTEEIFKESSN